MGLTLGPRGARYTVNTSGRRTASVGLPGTGLWWQESSGGGRRKASPPLYGGVVDNHGDPLHVDKPGLLSNKAERAFYEYAMTYLVKDSNKTFEETKKAVADLKQKYPEISNYLDFTLIAQTAGTDGEAALALCEKLWQVDDEFFRKPIATKYFDQFTSSVPIARGINFLTRYNHDYLAFTYSEILQAFGKFDKALEIIQAASPSEDKDIAILDLYLSMKRYEDVLDETNDDENLDDKSVIRLIFRAIAFREDKQYDVAIETFRMALAKKKREESILHFALYERACTYELMGKIALAKKDLSKILAEDYQNKAAQDKLEQLNKESKK